jgi:hypothetical protein
MIIAQSQEGFDMRFGNPGCMWGKAVYFAQNASYSTSYAFRGDNCRKFFLAEVLLGEVVPLQQQSLIKPPNKPGTTIEYDSVRGHTGGSDVYMVYANQKCYPKYLITYR